MADSPAMPSSPDSSSPVPSGSAPSRLDRLSGLVRRTLQRTLAVAAVSAVSAGVLWWLVAGQFAAAGRLSWWLAVVLLAPLLVPAGVTWLAVNTVQGVLTLPEVLRGMLAESKTQAAVVRAERGQARAVGFVRLLWALRVLATDARGKAVAALALFRLSRLPLLVAAIVAFVLNFAVILAALIALGIVLL
ncbi:MAG: hypothetical protein AAFU38_07625 [Bacteroidota bacterium]